MNRIEALNILGLDDDATDRDIKVAYKECVQILHPDRFAGNAQLQDRANVPFKRTWVEVFVGLVSLEVGSSPSFRGSETCRIGCRANAAYSAA